MIRRRVSVLALMLAMASAPAFSQPAPAMSPEELAQKLAERAAPTAAAADCEVRLRDGSCADVIDDTRQMKKGMAAMAGAAAGVLRSDIQMSFLLGSAELTAQARATLDRFAAALVRVGRYPPFAVEGHTDRSGSRETNIALSQARAASVVSYLAAKGVDRSRLTARGYGFDQPLGGRSADDPSNRRVEVVAR
jgi:outer membrane protein OmpA-like peptidoglycan-associated protein